MMSPSRGLWGMLPISTGLFLGLLNTLVISIGIGLSAEGEPSLAVATLVFMFTIIPGLAMGALLGIVAHAIRTWPVAARVGILIVPAVGLLALLANAFGLMHYVSLGTIPTLVATLILEKTTRHRDDPALPVARVE